VRDIGGKEEKYMKETIKYTDAPPEIERAIEMSQPIADFLPPPEKLVRKVEKERITIQLDKTSLDFFRDEAKKHGVGYQTMINNLISDYVAKVSPKRGFF
jgi:uncharacterized protein (DUF4415 family)